MSDEFDDPKPKFQFSQNLTIIIGGVLVVVIGFFAYMYFGTAAEKEAQVQAVEARRTEEKEKRTYQDNEVKRLEAINKANSDRERDEKKAAAAAEAQKAEYEASQKQKRDEFEATRRQAAARKLAQLKNLLQSDLSRFETELLKVDNEITANNMKLAKAISDKENLEANRRKERSKIDEWLADLGPELEKARRDASAAKNQVEYTGKKIDEATLQIREYQKKGAVYQDAIVKLNAKIDGLKKEQTLAQATGAKADTFVQSETARRQGEAAQRIAELNRVPVDIETPRAQQAIKDLMFRREKVQRLMKEKVLELTQLRVDPDYAELTKLGGDVDIQKTIDQTNALIASMPPKMPEPTSTVASGSTTSTPATPTTTTAKTPGTTAPPVEAPKSDVTVSTKKEKITVYTLKDGKTVSATKAVDAGDTLSVKTLDGKFQNIFKEDIVKEEAKQE